MRWYGASWSFGVCFPLSIIFKYSICFMQSDSLLIASNQKFGWDIGRSSLLIWYAAVISYTDIMNHQIQHQYARRDCLRCAAWWQRWDNGVSSDCWFINGHFNYPKKMFQSHFPYLSSWHISMQNGALNSKLVFPFLVHNLCLISFNHVTSWVTYTLFYWCVKWSLCF